MAGCGSKKKMAKGGMVSPRKAMAMGKKPIKKALGGMVNAAGQPISRSAAMADLNSQMATIRDLQRNGMNSTMSPGLQNKAAVLESIGNLKKQYATSAKNFGVRAPRWFKKGGAVKKGCK